ncbi:unnamed protein product [Miscanthus lutarioriparius]|uniref:Uncharacterized protein n=1 Tax=Miscanthus lutarioriparius TaxID=422564 RepID=A0A811RXQ6_9POAL|nr:unnamed protein product [Miscanthus lutarioriparius]
MAATASVTTTAPSPPALLKASPSSSLISFRPVSGRCKHLCVKTKATENDQSAKKPQKVNSILCQDCKGNVLVGFVAVAVTKHELNTDIP